MLCRIVTGFLLLCFVTLSERCESHPVVYLQPYNLSVTNFSLTTISLEWFCDCSKYTQYQLWYWPVNASMDLTMTVTKATNYVIRNLEPGQLYSVWLLAAEANMTSEYVTLQYRTSSCIFGIYKLICKRFS